MAQNHQAVAGKNLMSLGGSHDPGPSPPAATLARFSTRMVIGRRTIEGSSLGAGGAGLPAPLVRVREGRGQSDAAYDLQVYEGEIVLMRCTLREPVSYDAAPLWASVCRHLSIHEVPGDHRTVIREPSVDVLADSDFASVAGPRPRSYRTQLKFPCTSNHIAISFAIVAKLNSGTPARPPSSEPMYLSAGFLRRSGRVLFRNYKFSGGGIHDLRIPRTNWGFPAVDGWNFRNP